MPVLRINERQHSLGSGKTRLGGGADVDVRISDDEQVGTQAVIDLSDTHAVIRRNGDAVVKVNGVPLGAEPTPLMHGDKIEIAGRELFYAEDTKAGTTRHVMQSEVRSILEKRPGAPRATIGTGGRLVSLVDGKEVVTIEGLAQNGRLHPVQQAFIEETAMQCGYCIPGFIMAAAGLLNQEPQPDRARIREALAENICRCGTYPRIERAVERAAAIVRAEGEAR